MPTPRAGYRTRDGQKQPSVTTVNGRYADKQNLIPWAYYQGREHEALAQQGKPGPTRLYEKVDQACDIGTLVHSMCEADVKGLALPEIPEQYREAAHSAFGAYLQWKRHSQLKIVEVEVGMVSEQYRYGGTLDFICEIDGQLCLGDFKTSKAVYPEHLTQLAAYRHLWNECNPDRQLTGGSHLLRISKEHGDFAHHYYPDLGEAWELFKLYRAAYDLDYKVKQRAR